MSFSKVLGQPRAASILSGFLATGRLPQTLLFAGPEGTGKALMAREFGKTLLCRGGKAGSCEDCLECRAADKRIHPDLKNVDALYQAGLEEEDPAKQKSLKVDTIRHLRRDMAMPSMLGGWKLAVVEEAHTLEIAAANALLKILEEPPPRTLWILVTPQPERLPRTVVSRCFRVAFSPLPRDLVEKLLIKNNVERGKALRLAALGEGSVSRALALSQSPGYPESLLAGELAPFAAAEALARELPLARTQVELALFSLSQVLRLRHLEGRVPFSRVEGPLRSIWELRRQLRANADPRHLLALAAIEVSRDPRL